MFWEAIRNVFRNLLKFNYIVLYKGYRVKFI